MATAQRDVDLAAALAGDPRAWKAIVDEFSGLVWSVVRSFRMDETRREDAFQATWLRLLDKGHSIREPAALPGWLATVARRECLAALRADERIVLLGDDLDELDEHVDPGAPVESQDLYAAVRASLAELDERCRLLLSLLASDPPPPYAVVSEIIEIPVGSIGPTRQRCLDKLRRRPAIARIDFDRGSSNEGTES